MATAAERHWDYAAIGALIGPLVTHYQSSSDVKRLVTEADVEWVIARAKVEERTLIAWWDVLITAMIVPGAIDAILRRAIDENPDDEELIRAFAAAAAPTAAADAFETLLAALESLPMTSDEETEDELVDRDEAVAFLRSELEDVYAKGAGKALVLLGDSGVGKTRLAGCAARAARERDMLVLDASCLGPAGDALQPLRDALKSHRGRPTLEELLRESSAELRQYAPFLTSFLRLDGPAASGPARGGSTEQGVYEGLAEVLLGLAGRHGLCLVVDDLTDADQGTLHFLDYFRRKAAANRVLTISTVKQDFLEAGLRDLVNRWVGDGCQVHDVQPLGADDAARLIALRWDGAELDAAQVAGIVSLTGGNPFFIEQYLKERAESDSFDREVPDRVDAVLTRRVARLDAEARRFLDAAAVALEASNRFDLLVRVAEVGAGEASLFLRQAVEARALVEDAAGGVSFIQEVLRRVVYRELGAQARLELHGRAAEWLEHEGLLASAAHHYERAGRTEDLRRTALQGAAAAEHAGVYREALELYERALPFGELEEIGPRLAKAYLVVGRSYDAEELLGRLPTDAVEVRLLRAELFAFRGDYRAALKEMEFVRRTPSARKVEALIRLADVNLYLGELRTAGDHARAALAAAGDDAAAAARSKGAIGASAFFAGRVEEGEREFVEAIALLSSQPVEERDQYVYTTLLGNVGFAAEVRERWEDAKRYHEEALAKRREVSDARGTLQSLHALARTDFGLGSDDGALRWLEEARDLAASLGDRLEEGKIEHTQAGRDLRRSDAASAVGHAENALRQFEESGTGYDVTHARFTLAEAFAAKNAHRRAVEEGAEARLQLARKDYGLLSTLFPERAFTYVDRIAAGLRGYAYGDAVGLTWEGKPPAEIDMAQVPLLPSRPEWPKGATSDDTALTLLVAEHLVESGRADGAAFLELLAERAASIKGLGPSTTAAIEHYRRTGRAPEGNGNTNGALMRSLPVGWAVPLGCAQDRRAWTVEVSRATHPGAEACCAALVGSACAAWAIEAAEPSLLLEIALGEAAAAQEVYGFDGRLRELLTALESGRWEPDREATELDSYETLARVLWCVLNESRLPEAMLLAVRFGGDTDTVAALVGGLLGCRLTPEAVRTQVPWSGDVRAPADAEIGQLAAGLAALRTGAPLG